MGFSWSDVGTAVGGFAGGISGGALGNYLGGKADDRKAAQDAPQYGTVRKKYPQGTAGYFDDSYGPLLDWMRQQPGGAVSGGYENILANFAGDQEALEGFLRNAAPFLASASLEGSPAFRAVQGLSGTANPMQAYGSVAGQVAQTNQQGAVQGQQALARQGLGRSSAMASLASSASANTAGQQASLFTNLYQSGLDQRRKDVLNAYDAQQGVAQLALGMNPVPRAQGAQAPDPLIALAGGAGNLIGMLGAAGIAS